MNRSSHWEVLFVKKKGVRFCQVSMKCTLVEEFKCSGARNKLRTGVLPRIFNHATENLGLPL